MRSIRLDVKQRFITAAKQGDVAMLDICMREHVDINTASSNRKRTALMFAAKHNHPQIVNTLLCCKNIKINTVDKQKFSALMLATYYANEDIVSALLAANANVDLQSKAGSTALMIAVINQHANIVCKLLAAGADINAKNNDGKKALDIAIKNQDHQIAALIQSELEKRALKTHTNLPAPEPKRVRL